MQFLLNGRLIQLENPNPHQMLIDFLREDARLTGTKEGCKEGDCGACTIIAVHWHQQGYYIRAINSCITMMPMIAGCALITIDALNNHIIQQKMVELHASQCGFCTPGFVMALYGHALNQKPVNRDEIERSLSGNLCRCTGYQPILQAGMAALGEYSMIDDHYVAGLPEIARNNGHYQQCAIAYDGQFALEYLAQYPDARIVAGATDLALWVNKKSINFSRILFINQCAEWQEISENDHEYTIGALVHYNQLSEYWRGQNGFIDELLQRFAGNQVRNSATIGGNIANGSPIGDGAPLLIAMGAKIVLQSLNHKRTINLQDYFIEYGRQDRQPGEILTHIVIPKPQSHERIYTKKISKRFESDISAVMMAMKISLDGDIIQKISLCYGGMAGIPKRAQHCEEFLLGKVWNGDNLKAAGEKIALDFQPLTDLRATAQYRLKVAQNLLIKAWDELA